MGIYHTPTIFVCTRSKVKVSVVSLCPGCISHEQWQHVKWSSSPVCSLQLRFLWLELSLSFTFNVNEEKTIEIALLHRSPFPRHRS